MVLGNEVSTRKTCKTRGDPTLVRPVRAVADEVDAHLALGRPDGGVCLAERYRVDFAEYTGSG